ncbi:MAG TPA: glycosidase [Bacteroidales bacterium]|nr:glycosidase [Bacteroidales bacterium]
MNEIFKQRQDELKSSHENLIKKRNIKLFSKNGIYNRFQNPVLTRDHIPLHWRFDFNQESNPYLMERIGFNATFNAGAIKWEDKFILAVRVEGNNRKSIFALAESPNGIDNFRFWDRPVTMPEWNEADGNIYDMRLTRHDDGYIYGVFCAERKDKDAPPADASSAIAAAGLARTKDLINWERLPDLITSSPQQRNVVLFPHFVKDQYAFYTRPQDGFIETGAGGGIGFGLSPNIVNARIENDIIVDPKHYHTIYEVKNGLGPAPLKTDKGWLQLAHGVRNTAAGLRYTLYMFMTDLEEPWKVIYKPGGHFMGPLGHERVGDVSNVLFSNGWILDEDGTVYIYYASSDTRMHVATAHIDRLVDYCVHTPEDKYSPANSVKDINELIDKNKSFM